MGDTKTRLYYLDNLKALSIFSLFIWHTCEVFHCKEGFYVEGSDSLVFTLMYCFASPWLMSLMFFISGMATMLSLKKRSIKQYYSDRFKRVVRPVFAGIILWVPVEAYFCLKNHTDYSGGFVQSIVYFFTHIQLDFYGYDGSFSPAQLWFMCFLIAYIFLFFPVIRYILKKNDDIANMNYISWISIAAIVIITFVFCYGSTEETFLAFALFFGLGLLLYNNNHFFNYVKKYWVLFLILGVVSNICASVSLIHIRDIENIWTLEYALCRFIWSIGRVMGVLGALGIGQKYLNSNDSKWKYITRNSYNYYFVHMQVLIAIAYLIVTYINVAIGIQWILISSLSIIATFCVVEVMKRIKLFRWLFGLTY